jgi:hypothetical protein
MRRRVRFTRGLVPQIEPHKRTPMTENPCPKPAVGVRLGK